MKEMAIPKAETFGVEQNSGQIRQQTMDFKEFLLTALKTYSPLGSGKANIEKAKAIKTKIREAKGKILLHDDQLLTLKAAVEDCAWNPAIAEYLLPLYDALEAAKEA